MYRTRQFLLGALLLIEGIASPHIASAAPITVAGFTFAQGELDFADDAVVISGTVTGATAAQVRSTLIGASLRDSIRLITPDVAVVEIAFSDNAIVNGPGTDLVIFELSGSGRPVGYADATERFEFSVLGASGFSPFAEVIPVNTGFLAPHDVTLSAYVVQIDLADFGFAPNERAHSVCRFAWQTTLLGHDPLTRPGSVPSTRRPSPSPPRGSCLR